MHDQHAAKSVIDLNRAGVALMEIVSEPDIRSPEEAGAYVRKIRQILRYLGTCDGQYGRRLDAGGRECLGPQIRRAVPDSLRDKKTSTRCAS